MAKNLFMGKSHSSAYAKFRIAPPQHLIDRILQYVYEKISTPLSNALDVGCGSGQSTLALTHHFQKVIGLDVSSSQLDEARISSKDVPNVSFSVSGAEDLPIDSSTVQLITASQCLHWFNMDKFYSEAKRVLVPNGVLAVYAYMLPILKSGNEEVDKKLNEEFSELYHGPIGSYWDPGRKFIERRYCDFQLPFSDYQRIEGIWTYKKVNVADIIGYVTTWSAYQTYIKEKGQQAGQEILSEFAKRMMNTLQPSKSEEESTLEFAHEYILLIGRNSNTST